MKPLSNVVIYVPKDGVLEYSKMVGCCISSTIPGNLLRMDADRRKTLSKTGMKPVDCPALLERFTDRGYPFGNKVPVRIKMLQSVRADFPMRLTLGLTAFEGEVYPAWTNSFGAVSAVLPGDNKRLGLKPGEFEVVEWWEPEPDTSDIPEAGEEWFEKAKAKAKAKLKLPADHKPARRHVWPPLAPGDVPETRTDGRWHVGVMVTQARAIAVAKALYPDEYRDGYPCSDGPSCDICSSLDADWTARVREVRQVLMAAFG